MDIFSGEKSCPKWSKNCEKIGVEFYKCTG